VRATPIKIERIYLAFLLRVTLAFLKSTEQAIKPRYKVKEPEALKVMAAYYKENKTTLSPEVRKHKDLIVELIMEGFSAAEAFVSVLCKEI
jgi:CRISPR/Cas system CMR-associated protein Cmr5 small subunit